MPFASSDEAFRAVADYPKGCYEGPRPAEGDDIELLTPSCIFSLKGVNPDGVYQETGGIVIRTNMDGKWGEMRIQVDLKKSSTNEETEVNVQTSGWAHVGFEHDDISFHFNSASGGEGFFTGTPKRKYPFMWFLQSMLTSLGIKRPGLRFIGSQVTLTASSCSWPPSIRRIASEVLVS
ncbi:hypothetical protein FOZ60_016002 [Perkinsus olseni]|uniref:Uncharacterized protein n=1 Tax=Perkinsus olseni TaxID=32597 RepID=A0A7J6P766_PEROL|nr:hypothetical protein FOZ60_016002 [Perkinsus olseni]